MITLFIDTSSSDVSIAIIKDQKIISYINKHLHNEHSIYTVDFIDKALKEANLSARDIQKIMVVNGPGSFTGVRIGVTIAKVFAYVENIDIITLSALKILALSQEHNYCLSLIDARHDNYYIGLYDKSNNEVIKEQFNTKEKVLELIKKYQPTIVSNSDFYLNNQEITKQELNLINIVNYYQNMIPQNPHLVIPNYLKLPQALEEKHD